MFCLKRLGLLFYVFLFLFCDGNLFAGLLPEAIVEVGENEYKMVKDFKKGDKVISLAEVDNKYLLCDSEVLDLKINKKSSNKAVLLELTSEDGKSGLLMIGEDQKFYKMGDLHKLKAKLFDYVKKDKEKFLKILFNAVWVDAKNLEVGDEIRGSQNNSLKVTKIEPIELDENVDFCELSLKSNHTFYLIDTAGHYVLTHNIGFLAFVCIGALIGGVAGGGYAAWSSHKKGILSKKTIIRGALIGVVVGAATAAIIYGLVMLRLEFFSNGNSSIVNFLSKHQSIKDFIEIVEKIYSNIGNYPDHVVKLLNQLREGFTQLCKGVEILAVSTPIGVAGIGAEKYEIDGFVEKTFIRETEDTNFVGMDDEN